MTRMSCLFLIGLCLVFAIPKPVLVHGIAAFPVEAANSTCPSWQATYFDDTRGYSAPPVVRRDDAQIDFDWGYGPPAAGMVADHFSVRWVCTTHFPAGTYRFTATSDDGISLFVEGQPLQPTNAFADLVYALETLVDMDLAVEHEILPLFHHLWGLRGRQDSPALEQMGTIQSELHDQFAPLLPG